MRLLVRSRSLVLLPLIAVAASVGVGCVASTDAGSVAQMEPIETHATEAVGKTAQADLIGDIATAAIDMGALLASFASEDPEVGATIIAFAASEKDDQALAADYSDDPADDTKARLAAMSTAIYKVQQDISYVYGQLARIDATITKDVNTLEEWDIHQNIAIIDSCSRILVDNGAPLGQGLTDAARRQLQTGVDLLEPQISDSLEFDIKNFPPLTDINVRRLAFLTWASAVRLRVAYGAAGIPLTREWVLARQAFRGNIAYGSAPDGLVSDTPGLAGYQAFERSWGAVFRAFLDEYKPIRGVGDFDGDGYPDLVVHDAGTGKVKIWPVGSDYKVGIPATTPTSASGGGYTIGNVDATQWRLRAVGDVNGDGYPDLMWETADGFQESVWYMKRLAVTQYAMVPGVSYPVGVARARASLPSEMVGANPNLTNWVPSFGNKAYAYNISTFDWYPRGLGDFNGDGFGDLVWLQRSTGKVNVATVIPDSNDASSTFGIRATLQPTSWNGGGTWDIRGVGDFNRDGHPDILWEEDATKHLGVWLMNGTTVLAAPDLTFRPLKKGSSVIHAF